MSGYEVIVHNSADEVAEALAERLIARLAELQRDQRVPQLCLTGGRIATKAYQHLAADGSHSSVDWSRVELWWGDERFVPAGDADRNADATLDILRPALHLDPDRVHIMPPSDAGLDLDAAADAYATELGSTTFDICLLGMGPDGHVASIFPEHPSSYATGEVIGVRSSPKPPPERISLTLPVINRSDEVWFVVSWVGQGGRRQDGPARHRPGPGAGGRRIRHRTYALAARPRRRRPAAPRPRRPPRPDLAQLSGAPIAATVNGSSRLARRRYVEGTQDSVVSADGTRIGFLTGGEGSPLLLVHGGMCSSARWGPLWPLLLDRFQVTAMDRRGRRSSEDATGYSIDAEYADVLAVAEHLSSGHRRPIDVFGHSYGAVCALGAARLGAPLRRLALYEPPGVRTVPSDWLNRVRSMIARREFGRAMRSFLIEVIGLTVEQVELLRHSAGADESLSIVEHTMLREAEALSTLGLPNIAAEVAQPVLLLLGSASPPWAGDVIRSLADALPAARVAVLTDQGHEAVDTAPELVATQLRSFFLDA